MTWWAIEVTPGAQDPGLVAHELARLTGQAVEERASGEVVGFLADSSETGRVAAALAAAFGPDLAVRVTAVAPIDWIDRWHEGLDVRRVGRLAVGPSWLLEPGPERIVVDPEMAFGTGEHGSTRGALRLLGTSLRPGSTVLDLGSGSGILTIGAVKLGAARAFGIEIDAEAIPFAEANAQRNGVAERVQFVLGDAALLAPLLGPADLVVSNILRSVNVGLLGIARAVLAAGSTAIFAGMEVPERPLFLAELGPAGFEPVEEVVDAGWWSVAARAR